jgi:hypothetical protein
MAAVHLAGHPMTDQAPHWVRRTVEDFHRIKRELPILQQRSFDEGGRRGWRLLFQGEPVAVWAAGGVVNEVMVRVR